jgi:hypothetical protein
MDFNEYRSALSELKKNDKLWAFATDISSRVAWSSSYLVTVFLLCSWLQMHITGIADGSVVNSGGGVGTSILFATILSDLPPTILLFLGNGPDGLDKIVGQFVARVYWIVGRVRRDEVSESDLTFAEGVAEGRFSASRTILVMTLIGAAIDCLIFSSRNLGANSVNSILFVISLLVSFSVLCCFELLPRFITTFPERSNTYRWGGGLPGRILGKGKKKEQGDAE